MRVCRFSPYIVTNDTQCQFKPIIFKSDTLGIFFRRFSILSCCSDLILREGGLVLLHCEDGGCASWVLQDGPEFSWLFSHGEALEIIFGHKQHRKTADQMHNNAAYTNKTHVES